MARPDSSPSLGSSSAARRRDVELSFAIAREEPDLTAIFDLRRRVYEGRADYLLANGTEDHPASDRFDAHSLHFCCRNAGEVIAACRFTPVGVDGWEVTEAVEASCPLPPVPPEELVQVGRVVVAPRARGGRAGEVLMYFCCHHFAVRPGPRFYFAVCSPPLVRFYRHFGVALLSPEELQLRGRGENRYQLVHGDFHRSLCHLGAYLRTAGWELPAAVREVEEAAPWSSHPSTVAPAASFSGEPEHG